MDVEGEEMWSLPQMINSGAFTNVRQLHIEVNMIQLNANRVLTSIRNII